MQAAHLTIYPGGVYNAYIPSEKGGENKRERQEGLWKKKSVAATIKPRSGLKRNIKT